jgi:hypothetical protein
MFRHRKHHKRHLPEKPETREQIARATKKKLIMIFSALAGILIFLIFEIGISLWPLWLVDIRKQFIALLVFIVIFLAFLAPIIIEYNSDPRPLSGPGRIPRWMHRGDE